MNAEKKRLLRDKQGKEDWRKWGPYLSSRQWGTVRENRGMGEDAWEALTFYDSHHIAYRFGEDGIGGISDSHHNLCFAFTFWNGEDLLLKEKLFGVSNAQGNHGEDVKELYYFLMNTPTHAYMKYLYKYPQQQYPYHDLQETNQKLSQKEPEYELLDTGIFEKDQYFDLFIEYAKGDPEDVYIRLSVENKSEHPAPLHVLPTFWARNRWDRKVNRKEKPEFSLKDGWIVAKYPHFGTYYLYAEQPSEILFTENETKKEGPGYYKDGFHEYLIHQKQEAIHPEQRGTKAAFHFLYHLAGKEKKTLILRLSTKPSSHPLKHAEHIFAQRQKEAEQFYQTFVPQCLSEDLRNIEIQAFNGMLWNKQYYSYQVQDWLDEKEEKPQKQLPRNHHWRHLYSKDIFSVPDNWEYPAFYAWDLAFHMLPFARIDPEFAKNQLLLLTREWYMHPSGQLPAYEWNFSDVNPPVHAWATWRVYKIEQKWEGKGDRYFLERVFQKMLLNFTWWVNREDEQGKNIFSGGFLGLDNISVFNRSEALPENAELYQSDATSWMGMFCLNMLTMSLELAKEDQIYQDMATKFYEHFLYIADAINFTEDGNKPLWDEEEGFYYDLIRFPSGEVKPLKVRSLVGLIPLLAVTTIEKHVLEQFTDFKKRLDWFLNHRQDLCSKTACMKTEGVEGRRILAIVGKEKLRKILQLLLDENEFLSAYGIRSISRCHKEKPFVLCIDDHEYSVDYEPAESTLKLFGGNSNWRGPIWFPINLLLIESLQKYHHYYGDEFQVEFPTGSGHFKTLWEVSIELSKRLIRIFEADQNGFRPVYGESRKFWESKDFQPFVHFHEYFHGDTGKGLGASHQTGWTGLIAKLIQQIGDYHKKHPFE